MLDNIAQVLRVPAAYFYTVDDDLARLILSYSLMPSRLRKDLLKASERLTRSYDKR